MISYPRGAVQEQIATFGIIERYTCGIGSVKRSSVDLKTQNIIIYYPRAVQEQIATFGIIDILAGLGQ
jgi:hypothetical protein